MRFFFDIRDSETLIRDPDGSEFPNLRTACQDATLAARELMAEALLRGKPLGGRAFEIRDANGTLLCTLPFNEAIPTG